MLGAGLLAKKAVERGLKVAAVGQDQPGARIEGGHRVLRSRRAHRAARRAGLRRRGLRVHHLHRQLGPAAGRDLHGDRRSRTSRCARCCLATATSRAASIPRSRRTTWPRRRCGRLRAGRADGHRPVERAARRGQRRPAGLPARHLAHAGGGQRDDRVCDRAGHVPHEYAEVFEGDENWNALAVPEGDLYAWDEDSTYIQRPPYFHDMPPEAPEGFGEIRGARVLALLGDSVTTDHISPAGSIKKDSPAGQLPDRARRRARDFNSYGSRRGNHEVMMRGTFANIRLRNQLAPGTEGGVTTEDGEERFIYDAAMEYQDAGVPLLRAGRQGVRLRARRATGRRRGRGCWGSARHRRELRAHPPLQPGGHGRPARCSSPTESPRSRSGSTASRSSISHRSRTALASSRSPLHRRRAATRSSSMPVFASTLRTSGCITATAASSISFCAAL